MATKHTTTHSTGLTATRTSQNRTYAHAVWLRCSVSKFIANTKENLAAKEREHARYSKDLAANGELTQRWGAQQLQQWIDNGTTRITKMKAELENPEVNRGGWFIAGWSGSKQLAEGRAQAERNKGWEVEVTEAVR